MAVRLKRQELLTAANPPRVWSVVDEAALRRPVGGVRVMQAQLRRLAEVAELPNVTLQVVPFRAGGHDAAGGSFTILRFSEPDVPDVVYIEQLTGAIYLEKPVCHRPLSRHYEPAERHLPEPGEELQTSSSARSAASCRRSPRDTRDYPQLSYHGPSRRRFRRRRDGGEGLPGSGAYLTSSAARGCSPAGAAARPAGWAGRKPPRPRPRPRRPRRRPGSRC